MGHFVKASEEVAFRYFLKHFEENFVVQNHCRTAALTVRFTAIPTW